MNDINKMSLEIVKASLEIAKSIQGEVPSVRTPPPEGALSTSEMVFPHSLVKNTRGYIERITHQINGSYESGWYDACAVMLRRLIETLIIETFEYHKLEDKIKNSDGNYLFLKDLISITLNESSWTLGRDAKRALPRLKDIGDKSAHSRRFIAHRADIDKVIPDLRVVVQELVFLAQLQ